MLKTLNHLESNSENLLRLPPMPRGVQHPLGCSVSSEVLLLRTNVYTSNVCADIYIYVCMYVFVHVYVT